MAARLEQAFAILHHLSIFLHRTNLLPTQPEQYWRIIGKGVSFVDGDCGQGLIPAINASAI